MTKIVASKSLITASPQIDILDFTVGAVTVATATAYRVTRGTSYDELTGSFTYDSDGRLAGGTITGWKLATDGGIAFTATELSLPVADFLGLLRLNDTDGFLNELLGGDDKIIGSRVGDIFNGRGDDDSIAGGGGDDLLEGTDDNDTLDGGAANDALLGGSGNDSLLGGAGDDFLDGGSGTDTLAGGAGNDVYSIVDGTGDAIVETAGQGTDAVVTNLASFDLAALANVEDLRLTAPGSAGMGNALNNHIRAEGGNDTLTGGLGDDTLDGGAGADSLSGGQGNDTYIVDSAGDAVSENPGEGTDTIKTTLLAANHAAARTDEGFASPALLKGLIFDGAGNRMSPSHAVKGGKRYRYYVSQAVLQGRAQEAGSIARLPARELEQAVMDAVFNALAKDECTRIAAVRLEGMKERDRRQALRRVLRRVEVSDSQIGVTMDPVALGQRDNCAWSDDGVGLTTIELPFDIVRRDNGARALATRSSMPAVDSSTAALVRAVARGYAWRQQLLNGSAQSINEIAQREGITRRYVARLLRLGFLAPDIIAAILANRQPPHLTVDGLRGPIPFDWNKQRQLFGFDGANPAR